MILTRYKGNFKLEMHFTGWWHICVHIYEKKKLLWIFPYYSRVWTTYRQEPGTLLSLEHLPKWGLTDEEKGFNVAMQEYEYFLKQWEKWK